MRRRRFAPGAIMDVVPEPDPAVVPTAEASPSGTATADAHCERLLLQHAPLLYRIAYGVLRDHADAEDAVQESLQRAWRARVRFADVDNPAAWLARIVWRAALSRRRRTRLLPLDPGPDVDTLSAAGASAEHAAAQQEMARLVHDLIRRLPRSLRRPLILSTVEGLSSGEIAFVLGVSESAVRGRCLRARRILRERHRHPMWVATSGRRRPRPIGYRPHA